MKLLSIGLLALVIIYFSFRIFVGFSQGYEYAHMDWNEDGNVGILEIIESSDIGMREIKGCNEYYYFKDGLPITTICEK